ncbi:MAG: type II toxin-antitoxin system PrlF family antitoxin [Magnetococcus sp. YQC-5]
MRAIAKITAKGQTTIPQDVRAACACCGWRPDRREVGVDGTAMVRRVQHVDIEYLRAVEGTLSEWIGPADEEAYRDLSNDSL